MQERELTADKLDYTSIISDFQRGQQTSAAPIYRIAGTGSMGGEHTVMVMFTPEIGEDILIHPDRYKKDFTALRFGYLGRSKGGRNGIFQLQPTDAKMQSALTRFWTENRGLLSEKYGISAPQFVKLVVHRKNGERLVGLGQRNNGNKTPLRILFSHRLHYTSGGGNTEVYSGSAKKQKVYTPQTPISNVDSSIYSKDELTRIRDLAQTSQGVNSLVEWLQLPGTPAGTANDIISALQEHSGLSDIIEPFVRGKTEVASIMYLMGQDPVKYSSLLRSYCETHPVAGPFIAAEIVKTYARVHGLERLECVLCEIPETVLGKCTKTTLGSDALEARLRAYLAK